MASLLKYLDNDLTLSKMSELMYLKSQETFRPRSYLGMSEVGEDCWRMIWYRFRNVLNEGNLALNSILAIEDGYKQEDIMAARLRLLPSVKLDTVDPENGEQFAFKFFGGHFAGHCDGKIIGILEAPKTQHIWENKAVNSKKFEVLKTLIADHKIGEKKALAAWDPSYYAQAIIYMYASKLTRHYLTVETPGGRDYTSCRTEADNKVAQSLMSKAEAIIKADSPLTRMSNNRTFYKCGWCKHKEICFDGKVPDVNCRTCCASEPNMKSTDGIASWKCYKKDCNFTGQGKPCNLYIMLNTLVPYKVIDYDKLSSPPNWIKYQDDKENIFYNVNSESKKIPGSICLTGDELKALDYFELVFSNKEKKEKQKEKLSGEI